MLNIEPGEEAPALLLTLYLAVAIASFVVARSVRESLFLSKFNALGLPYMYLGIALATGFLAWIYARLSARFSQVNLITWTLLFFIVNILVEWWAVRQDWPLMPWIFYLWASLYGIVIAVQAWTVANHVLNVRQAKRLFALISSGGILGSVTGGVIAAAAVKLIGTDHLILVLVPFTGLCILLAQVLMRRYARVSGGAGSTPPARREPGGTPILKTISGSRYLKLIVILIVVSELVALTVDFQFKLAVQQVFHSKDQFTAFFGKFSAAVSILSLVLQVLVGSLIVEKFGVRLTLFVLPLALTAGTAIVIAYPLALWAGSILKGSDQMVRYSLDKASVELLYLPVPKSVKAEAKATIDMVVTRAADGMGGLLLLLVTRVMHQGQVGVSILNLGLLLAWLSAAYLMRQEYVRAVQSSIRERPPLPASILKWTFSSPNSIASLKPMFEAREEETVLYAMELARAAGRIDWIPQKLLSHPSPEVRKRAIELLPLSFDKIQGSIAREHDSTVRSTWVYRASQVAPHAERLSILMRFAGDVDLKVRLAGLAGLAKENSREAVKVLTSELTKMSRELTDSAEPSVAVAEGLGEIHHEAAIDLQIQMLKHADARVRKAAARSASRFFQRGLVPFLVRLLPDRDAGPEARRTLQVWGPHILGTLADILGDPQEELEMRRSIPLVAAGIPGQAAADLLVECLFDQDGLLRYRAIRVLGKLHAGDPNLTFRPEKLGLAIRQECEKTLGYQQALAQLYPSDIEGDLLARLLKEKVKYGQERIFRLLGLMIPQKDAYVCLMALKEDDRAKRASAAEFLDIVLPAHLKKSVLPLIEPFQEKLKKAGDTRRILETLMKSPDPILRDCATAAAGRGRWPEVSLLSPKPD